MKQQHWMRGRRCRTRTAFRAVLAIALAVVAGAPARATEGETYATSTSKAIVDFEQAWLACAPTPVVALCTGSATTTCTEQWRDPDLSTLTVPMWKDLSAYVDTDRQPEVASSGGATTLRRDVGGDTDRSGIDDFLMYRFTAVGASLFLRICIETEDGAAQAWRIRYRGAEEAVVINGPMERAQQLEFVNPYAIAWNRRIVDFDALKGDYDEEKELRQDFAVLLRLIDGTEVRKGERFLHKSSRAASRRAKVAAEIEAGIGTAGPSVGGSLGFGWETERIYEVFSQLAAAEREAAEQGSVTVMTDLPCPSGRWSSLETIFEGDFEVIDKEGGWFGSDLGSRQELSLTVHNGHASIVATDCVPCPLVPPPPSPPLPPPPTTPLPPPTTPREPPLPIPPSEPVTTPNGPPLPSTVPPEEAPAPSPAPESIAPPESPAPPAPLSAPEVVAVRPDGDVGDSSGLVPTGARSRSS